MAHEFEYRFDPAFLRLTMKRGYLWKGYLLAAACWLYPLWARLSHGHWHAQTVLAYLALGFGILALFHYKLHSVAKAQVALWKQQSPSGVMKVRLDDEGIECVLENGQSRFAWKDLRCLKRYPDVWMLEVVPKRSVFFPPDALTPEQRAYVEERCREAGVAFAR